MEDRQDCRLNGTLVMDNIVSKLKVAEALTEGESISLTDKKETDTNSDNTEKKTGLLPENVLRHLHTCQRHCKALYL